VEPGEFSNDRKEFGRQQSVARTYGLKQADNAITAPPAWSTC
jgi:hypothetical protein